MRESVMPSDDTELSLTWRLTEQDVLRVTWTLTWRSQLIAPVLLALFALGCFLVALLFVLGVAEGDWGTFVGGVLMGLFFSFLAWMQPILTRQAICNAFNGTPGAGDNMTGIFSPNGMILAGSHSQSESAWPAVLKVIETRTDFLFFLSPDIVGPIIPKVFIPAPEGRERLRKILRDAISERAKLLSEPA